MGVVRGVTLLILSIVLLCLVSPSKALGPSAILGIDLGSDVFKMMILQGNSPEIILNEQSGRKTKTLVGFSQDGERLFGAAAGQLRARYPHRVISSPHHFLGKSYPDSSIHEDSYPFPIVNNNGTYGFQIDETVYSPEEVVAMLLEEAVRMTKSVSSARISDCTIVIPPSLTQSQRLGLVNAGKIAGLNIILLAHEGTSTAVQYLRSRLLAEEELDQYTIFYDVGHSHASATLVRFVIDKTKNTTINRKIMSNLTAWENVGGNDFDQRLTDFLLVQAEKDLGVDLRSNARIVTRLQKEARKAKEILSANKEVTVRIESLANDEDFSTVITRLEFEEMCEDLFVKTLAPINSILEATGTPLEDINIEIVGGGSRILKIGELVSEIFGERVGRHLNGDEAPLMGSTLYAATGRAGKRSSFIIKDTLNRAVGVTFDIEEVESATLFSKSSRTMTHKNKNVFAENPFSCHVYYEDEELLSSGEAPLIASFQIDNFPDFLALDSKLAEDPPMVKVRFDIDSAGLIDCTEAAVRYDEYVEQPVVLTPPPTPVIEILEHENTHADAIQEENEEEAAVVEEEEENEEAEEVPIPEEVVEEEEVEGEKEVEEVEEVKEVEEVEMEIVKKTRTVPLNISVLATAQQLTAAEIAKSRSLLSKLKREDKKRQLRAETKNELESFVYAALDMLEEEGIREVTTEEERETFSATLNQTGDWLYDEGEDATLAVYTETLDDLKAIGNKIRLRQTETELRPLVAIAFHEWKDATMLTLRNITKERRVDEDEKESLVDDIRSLETWLEEQQEVQASLAVTADPAWLTSELLERQKTLDASLNRLSRRRIRTPTPTPTPSPSPLSEEEEEAGKEEAKPFEFDFENLDFGGDAEDIPAGSDELPVEHDEL